jgi:hypothetical protein
MKEDPALAPARNPPAIITAAKKTATREKKLKSPG